MTLARRGFCFVLAAASGTGKSTLARTLMTQDPVLTLSVSVTTRAPRPSEIDGVHYHFVGDAAFDAMAARGELLEHARVFGRGYGTPRGPVRAALDAGRDVLFDIDWQGYRQLRAALPGDVVGVFVLPPSIAALTERLRRRADDDPDEIARRMDAARAEIAHWTEFDHVLVNDDLASTAANLRAILTAARLATGRQTDVANFVAGLAVG